MEKYSNVVFLLKRPEDDNNQRLLCSPSESISCSCCGNLQEVVTDREAARTSHGESLTHSKHTSGGNRAETEGFHEWEEHSRHMADVASPSSSLRETHTTSRQIFLSISTSASKKESTSSSVMSPAQKTSHLLLAATKHSSDVTPHLLLCWLAKVRGHSWLTLLVLSVCQAILGFSEHP